MKDGFLRTAAATPKIRVADPQYNAKQIIELMEQGESRGVKVMVFPELCLTGYTCSDHFFAGFPFGISKKGTETYRRSIKEAAYDRVCGSSLGA